MRIPLLGVWAGVETLLRCVFVLLMSKAPTPKRGVRMRRAASSIREASTSPLASAASMAAAFMKSAPGISWSRPTGEMGRDGERWGRDACRHLTVQALRERH